MTMRPTIALTLAVLLSAAASAAAAPRATTAQVRQAQDLQRHLDSLVRQQRALTRQFDALDARLARASDSERLLLESQRQRLVEQKAALNAERARTEADLAALPDGAKVPPRSVTGPIGAFDPQGLPPVDFTGGNGQVSNPRAFNPSIAVIPEVVFFRDSKDGGSSELVEQADGFHGAHGAEGHDHEGMVEGFNMREMELAFTASVDPYFDAVALLSVSGDAIEAEEVYFQTRGLPGGFQLKGGKFLSGIGYINRQHPHQWEFVDQNLAYELLLGGHGLNEVGLQATWMPRTPFYFQLGGELLQGTNEKFSNYVGAESFPGVSEGADPRVPAYKPGPRLFTGFAKIAPNLGYAHALQIGASFGHSQAHQEVHDHDGDGVPEAVFDGTGDFWGVDVVYKYDSPREYGAGDLTLQGEYLRRTRDMAVLGVDLAVAYKNDGWYAQAAYGIAPRWRLAGRVSQAGLTNRRTLTGALAGAVQGGPLVDYDTSSQYSVSASFSPTEFSRLRAQYNRGQLWVGGERQDFHQLFVQMQVSLGAHGAHRF
jgi:hypothetical protein